MNKKTSFWVRAVATGVVAVLGYIAANLAGLGVSPTEGASIGAVIMVVINIIHTYTENTPTPPVDPPSDPTNSASAPNLPIS